MSLFAFLPFLQIFHECIILSFGKIWKLTLIKGRSVVVKMMIGFFVKITLMAEFKSFKNSTIRKVRVHYKNRHYKAFAKEE